MPEDQTSVEVINPPEMIPFKVEMANSVESMLAQLIDLNDQDIRHEPTCPICSSPDRKEYEDAFKVSQSEMDVKKLYKDKTTKVISVDLIRNHMKQHYDKGGKEIQKREYINKLKRLATSSNLTTIDKIGVGIAALFERMVGINSIVPDTETSIVEVERTKSAETVKITGALNNLLKLQAMILGEMKDSGEVISIPRQAFVNIFNQALIEARTDDQKQVIRNILDKLSNINKTMQ